MPIRNSNSGNNHIQKLYIVKSILLNARHPCFELLSDYGLILLVITESDMKHQVAITSERKHLFESLFLWADLFHLLGLGYERHTHNEQGHFRECAHGMISASYLQTRSIYRWHTGAATDSVTYILLRLERFRLASVSAS